MRKHVRKAYIDTALGLGLQLDGGMACWIGDLEVDQVSVPWLPLGERVVLGRYPVRDAWSMRVVTNVRRGVPDGSIGATDLAAVRATGSQVRVRRQTNPGRGGSCCQEGW